MKIEISNGNVISVQFWTMIKKVFQALLKVLNVLARHKVQPAHTYRLLSTVTSKSDNLCEPASPLLVIFRLCTRYGFPRSTLHHGLSSSSVCVHEAPVKKCTSLLPSTALPEAPPAARVDD